MNELDKCSILFRI